LLARAYSRLGVQTTTLFNLSPSFLNILSFRNSVTNEDFQGLFHRKGAENAEIIFLFAFSLRGGKGKINLPCGAYFVLNAVSGYCLQWFFTFICPKKSPQQPVPFHTARDRQNKKVSYPSVVICGNLR
jgi:hypothetical protein